MFIKKNLLNKTIDFVIMAVTKSKEGKNNTKRQGSTLKRSLLLVADMNHFSKDNLIVESIAFFLSFVL
jgi:hypothetical protein